MSTVDTLLDAAVNDGKVIITVDEPSRTLKYDGTILLGVENDHLAERIYFQAPRYIAMDDTVDLLSEDIEIYVKYKNAKNRTSFTQCTDIEQIDENTIMFSWLISENVTDLKGTVQFSICIKKIQRFDEVGEITTLVDTEWDIYDDPNDNSQRISYPHSFSCVIDFTISQLSDQFVGLRYTYGGYPGSATTKLEFITADGIFVTAFDGNTGWTSASYQTIKIIGGRDTQNSTLIEFLQYQGTILSWPDYLTRAPIVFNEWHTTIFTGTILDGIEVNSLTPEIIDSETATTHLLIQKVDAFDAYLDGYRGAYTADQIDNLISTCYSDATKYTNTKINELESSVNNKLSFDEEFPASGEIIITSSQDSVKHSGMTLNDIIKSPRYTLLDTQTLHCNTENATGYNFYNVSANYNEVMVILTVENGTSSNMSFSIKLGSQATGAPIVLEPVLKTTVPQKSNSDGGEQIKYHILKTNDGINEEYNLPIDGYSMEFTSSTGETGYKRITIVSADSGILTIDPVSVVDGTNNIIIKVYGR